MYGTVKYYNQQKCYGFIGTSDGKEYFFHISGLNKNYGGKPNADDNVEFNVSEPNDKGSVCAYNVKPILTLNMVRKALGKEHLHLKSKKDEYVSLIKEIRDIKEESIKIYCSSGIRYKIAHWLIK